jgi:hypothetical protein
MPNWPRHLVSRRDSAAGPEARFWGLEQPDPPSGEASLYRILLRVLSAQFS